MKLRAAVHVLAFGLVCGTLVSSVMTYLDWRLNPGGLFYDSSGTNWRVVADTALSWFVPVALAAALLAAPFAAWWLWRARR